MQHLSESTEGTKPGTKIQLIPNSLVSFLLLEGCVQSKKECWKCVLFLLTVITLNPSVSEMRVCY